MRPTHLFAHAALVSALVIGCGPAEGSCAIDTDCTLGQRCSSDNLCVPLGGGGPDGGGARDAGDSRDAAVADARTDAPAPVDGGSDAGAPSCDAFAGTYVVGELTATCGTIAAGQSMVATNTGAATGCTLMLASEGDAMVLDGNVTLDESAEFIGTMLSVAGDPMNACTGRFTLAGLDVSCTNTTSAMTCMLGFTRAP